MFFLRTFLSLFTSYILYFLHVLLISSHFPSSLFSSIAIFLLSFIFLSRPFHSVLFSLSECCPNYAKAKPHIKTLQVKTEELNKIKVHCTRTYRLHQRPVYTRRVCGQTVQKTVTAIKYMSLDNSQNSGYRHVKIIRQFI